MIVQWCCKGVAGIDDAEARAILLNGTGIKCRLWQRDPGLSYPEALARLDESYLELHVNHYDDPDPHGEEGELVSDMTPFISLSAGCVDRDVHRQTNVLNPARRTALQFATKLGRQPGWVFSCYVIVTPNRAARIPAVAEEVRDLNQQRRYSPYFAEGEVAAKINVPSRQILAAERWEPTGSGLARRGGYLNRGFVAPRPLLNLRRML